VCVLAGVLAWQLAIAAGVVLAAIAAPVLFARPNLRAGIA
jgi:hypothetical protein